MFQLVSIKHNCNCVHGLTTILLTYFSGEAEDPALTPVTWISKWVDYSDKYGIGYNLSDGSVGVLYNDATRLLMNENEK